ncbi:MAG: hypothetical protein J6K58_05520 [Lachnospiraceae bacterium]|nr:hypothetical protein [Lachnospiraceae bacterium]
MGFRTLEISHAAEIHIKEGQLEVTTEEGVVVIPIEDLNQIMVHGANIIEEYAPKTGVVRLLRLTEKQYNNIYMVSGEADYQEKTVGANAHIML